MMLKKTDLSMFSNSWYRPGSFWKILLWYCCNVLFFINPCFPFSGCKIFLLKIFGTKIGKGVVIKPCVNIKYPWLLTIGNNVWIGENVWIDNLAKVIICDNVCVSQGAMLLCGNHDYTKSSFDLLVQEILLEDGVWVGAKATVCPGVVMRSHSILTVGSVATKTLDEYGIYQGNPAQKVKERKIDS